MSTLTRLLILLAACACLPTSAAPTTLYVSQNGNDAWSGTVPAPNAAATDGPLATLDAARAHIDTLKAAGRIGKDGVDVRIGAGTYHLTHPFTLAAADDIAPAPVVYEAVPGERVVIGGGVAVPTWTPVTDPAILARLDPAARGHVVQADLHALGITDFGAMTPRGFTFGIHPAGLELFFNGDAMPLARWPNDGWATTTFPPGVTDVAKSSQPDGFNYTGDRPGRWAADDDIWVHGFFGYDWADDYVKVSRIDTADHRIVLAGPQSAYGYLAQHRWVALNILEELDQPGEWYLDRNTGLIYFWPPSEIAAGSAEVSVQQSLLGLDHVSDVTFRGLTLQGCRADAVVIGHGDNDRIDHCLIRGVGNTGVVIDNDTNTGVSACEISGTGDGAVMMNAGDRPTLARGDCFIQDCRIHDYSRWCYCYRPAVSVNGVGNRVSHNAIYDAPHQAVQVEGNDNVVEYNDIHDVCRETGDAGAFYMGRDWTMRGNVVRYNYFHQIGHTAGLVGYSDTMSVYLDDMACGTLIFGNLFVDAGHAILIGGGRDNTVANNVFVDCKPVITLDARGLDWANSALAPGGGWFIQEKLAAVHYDQPPYSTRYPELAASLAANPDAPDNDTFLSNILVGKDAKNWLSIAGNVPKTAATIARNLVGQDPQFVDASAGDYHLKPTSPAFALGFRPIPIDQIGPSGLPSPEERGRG